MQLLNQASNREPEDDLWCSSFRVGPTRYVGTQLTEELRADIEAHNEWRARMICRALKLPEAQ